MSKTDSLQLIQNLDTIWWARTAYAMKCSHHLTKTPNVLKGAEPKFLEKNP